MCGIAGCSLIGGGANPLPDMLDTLVHRGPDDYGVFSDEHFSLGNRLLAIVDIGHGRQPFLRDWGGEQYVAVFNGEIYNHRDLRAELEAIGLTFNTRCDTEVALAAYAEWGAGAVERFEGQWALAVWHCREKRLFLCRDPLGIKPIYFHHAGSLFAFASEPKALFAHPGITKAPNCTAIQEYFLHGFAFAAGYSLNHRSFYKDIHCLEPGCHLTWRNGEAPRTVRYFHLHSAATGSADPEDYIIALRDTVTSSVQASMMGDAPIGVALSGGLDSSIIAAVAGDEMARLGRPPLLSSCITYRGQHTNEDAEHAALLANYLHNTAPLRLVYSHMDVSAYLSDLDNMIRHFDEPHWEIKQLAMFNNYKVLKQNGAKVVLTGEGADELFFGYFHRFPGFKNPVLRSGAELQTLWSRRLPPVSSLFAAPCSDDLDDLMRESIARWYTPFEDAGFEESRRMQFWYLATFLHWLLIDNDRCSMAFSLEGRFPFLNRRVIDLAMKIPVSLQVGEEHGQEKQLLRQAFRHILPEAIWKKRKKAPLPSPLKLAFHEQISGALETAIDEVPPSIWELLSRSRIREISSQFRSSVKALTDAGDSESGGGQLTRYLSLSEPWSLRTPQVFGVLSLLRWWTMNFN